MGSLPRSLVPLHRDMLARSTMIGENDLYWGEQRPTRGKRLWKSMIGPLVYRAKDVRRVMQRHLYEAGHGAAKARRAGPRRRCIWREGLIPDPGYAWRRRDSRSRAAPERRELI